MLRKAIVLWLLVFAVACGAKKAALEDLRSAGELFFTRFDGADYEAIHKDASQEYQKSRTKEETAADLRQIAEFGKMHLHALVQTRTVEEGKIFQPVYKVTLDRARGSIELTFIDERGQWKLHGFEFKKAG